MCACATKSSVCLQALAIKGRAAPGEERTHQEYRGVGPDANEHEYEQTRLNFFRLRKQRAHGGSDAALGSILLLPLSDPHHLLTA